MLVIIPARGGSKGVPGKNIKDLGRKPLIQYAIEAAQNVVNNDQIIVSTDSLDIKNVVENLGLRVPFLRPAQLATDTAGTQEVLLHAINWYEKNNPSLEFIILLQPTSPFRTGNQIKEALELFSPSLDMVVSVKETKANPYYVLREENDMGYLVKSKQGNFARRQDCPKVYEVNGAIYIINVQSLKNKSLGKFEKVKKYVMGEMASHDIDTPFDWLVAETIIKQEEGKIL